MKALLALALTALLLPGCGRKPESISTSQPVLPAARVRIQTAESKQQTATEEVVGAVRAKLRATLEARVSGRIDNMPVLLGQTVNAGQLLVHLDAAEIQARLEQAMAGLQQADLDWKRVSALFDQQAATRSDYDAADSRHRAAMATVAEARTMMDYVEVLAPFNGVVTKKLANVGDLASPGKSLLDMEDPSVLELEADVPEAIASRIQQNARLAVRVDSLNIELTGIVREISPVADPATRTFRVKLELPRTPGLMSGQFARLIVPVGERNSIRVPASAVVARGQMEIVFVIDNHRARLILVKTGAKTGDEIEILAGLEPGQSVVTQGAPLLVDGQPVEVE